MPSAFEQAKALALRLLARRSRSKGELGDRLRRAGFEGPEVAQVIARLGELGYLDDEAFARARAAALLARGRWGPRAAVARLERDRIDRAQAEGAVRRILEEASEEVLARQALSKRWPGLTRRSPPSDRARAARFLLRRGFAPSVAYAAAEISRDVEA